MIVGLYPLVVLYGWGVVQALIVRIPLCVRLHQMGHAWHCPISNNAMPKPKYACASWYVCK
jgi:hypothetical protein